MLNRTKNKQLSYTEKPRRHTTKRARGMCRIGELNKSPERGSKSIPRDCLDTNIQNNLAIDNLDSNSVQLSISKESIAGQCRCNLPETVSLTAPMDIPIIPRHPALPPNPEPTNPDHGKGCNHRFTIHSVCEWIIVSPMCPLTPPCMVPYKAAPESRGKRGYRKTKTLTANSPNSSIVDRDRRSFFIQVPQFSSCI